MDAGRKFYTNCCAKGRRAFMPYQSSWPDNLWFGPNDTRQDQWQQAFDPTTYPQSRYVCWRDSYNWGCVAASKNAYTLGYLQQRQMIDQTEPFGNPSGYPRGEVFPSNVPCLP